MCCHEELDEAKKMTRRFREKWGALNQKNDSKLKRRREETNENNKINAGISASKINHIMGMHFGEATWRLQWGERRYGFNCVPQKDIVKP